LTDPEELSGEQDNCVHNARWNASRLQVWGFRSASRL
jgi:hypothetical protein